MAYVDIPTLDLTSGRGAKASTIQQFKANDEALRDGSGILDDAIVNRHLATDSVNQDSIAAGSIHQGELDVGSEEDSLTAQDADFSFLTSAGSYALSVESSGTPGNGSFQTFEGIETDNTGVFTFGHYVRLINNGSATSNIRTTYINASAPFDIGDGEVKAFVWVLMNGNKIEAISSAPAPTWAYNGPTSIKPDRVKLVNGVLKKYKYNRVIDVDSGDVKKQEVEIGNELKNNDMDIFPHPFILNNITGKRIVILDPPETGYLSEVALAGQSINELLHKDYLRIDNEKIIRKTSVGVTPVKFKWKNTKSRAGEMIKDKNKKIIS